MRAAAACTYLNLGQPRSIRFDESKFSLFAIALGTLFVFAFAGCSSQNYTPATSYYAPAPVNYRGTRTEVASWYGPGFAGRKTSSGETYNPEGFTAASKTLPLGSRVRVMNPDTGRSVVVRINDRGPFVRGRSLDLSHGAAQQIGLTGKGVGRVQVTPTATSTPSATLSAVDFADTAVTPARHNLSYVSYRPRLAATTPRRRRYRYSSSRRMVANPIGAWIAGTFSGL